jgi:hypothetical protein
MDIEMAALQGRAITGMAARRRWCFFMNGIGKMVLKSRKSIGRSVGPKGGRGGMIFDLVIDTFGR